MIRSVALFGPPPRSVQHARFVPLGVRELTYNFLLLFGSLLKVCPLFPDKIIFTLKSKSYESLFQIHFGHECTERDRFG